MVKAIGLVQARMGSSRVPGKVMLPLAGHPLVWHVIDRMRRVEGLAEVVLATTQAPRNAPLVAFASAEGVPVFQVEAEDDLAARIAGAARRHDAALVLRTAADCPLVDPDLMALMLRRAIETDADFTTNRMNWSYPLGLSADVISRRALEWADANLVTPEDRELFAVWIRDHPEQFKVEPIVNPVNLSHHTWTVDEPEDVPIITRIFDALYREGECFGMQAVLDFLAREEGAR